MRDWIRRRGRPEIPARAIAFAALYGALSVGALSVAFGITAFVWARVGLYAGVAVGGVFVFAFPATVLYAIHLNNRPQHNDTR